MSNKGILFMNESILYFIGKKIVHKMDCTVNFTVLFLTLIMFLYGCYALWDTNQIYQEADSTEYEKYKPSNEESLSFEELKSLNPEVIGWISIYGTKVDYPIVQTDNNEKYVNTNIKGEYSLSGSIFLDYRNQKKFTDFNSILYGHHMEQSAMFGDVGNFNDSAYFDNHKYGTLFINGKNYGVEFFAFLLIDAYDNEVYVPGIKGDSHRQSYLDKLFTIAVNKSNISVEPEDRIVLLSTCTTDITNGRQILIGKISDIVYPDTLGIQKPAFLERKIDSQSWKTFIRDIPVGLWILIGLFWVFLVVAVFNNKNKREKG